MTSGFCATSAGKPSASGIPLLFPFAGRIRGASFRFADKQYALGQSEEEIVTPIAAQYVNSYKDLPVSIYQIGQKYGQKLDADQAKDLLATFGIGAATPPAVFNINGTACANN